eukprot:293216-Pyramimonas_sp.AAC.1
MDDAGRTPAVDEDNEAAMLSLGGDVGQHGAPRNLHLGPSAGRCKVGTAVDEDEAGVATHLNHLVDGNPRVS